MDEWPLMSRLAMPEGETAIVEHQHTTTEERCIAAEAMRDTYAHKLQPMHLVVDPMDMDDDDGDSQSGQSGEVFSNLLHPWPTRFYIMEPAVPVAAAAAAAAGGGGSAVQNAEADNAHDAGGGAGAAGDTQSSSSSTKQGAAPNLQLSWCSFFEPDSTIDFTKFSDAVLSRLQ